MYLFGAYGLKLLPSMDFSLDVASPDNQYKPFWYKIWKKPWENLQRQSRFMKFSRRFLSRVSARKIEPKCDIWQGL
ncbi:hypothetical protein LYNGBM3L_70090 [Moorena producens 3L]|uniref:Uncharacterized protein n=1 Tax=Moorena producens 3L TaxID=489825 RepID=F4Y2Y3_9CYAN|nr:hypothetical protein LYNGBM3L_70090 [Moorena producens 3L]